MRAVAKANAREMGYERDFHKDRLVRLDKELDAGVFQLDTPGARDEKTSAARRDEANLVSDRKWQAHIDEIHAKDEQIKESQQSRPGTPPV